MKSAAAVVFANRDRFGVDGAVDNAEARLVRDTLATA